MLGLVIALQQPLADNRTIAYELHTSTAKLVCARARACVCVCVCARARVRVRVRVRVRRTASRALDSQGRCPHGLLCTCCARIYSEPMRATSQLLGKHVCIELIWNWKHGNTETW